MIERDWHGFEQLALQPRQDSLPILTYSEREAVLDLIERLTEANKALKAEVQRLLKERNELLVLAQRKSG